MFEVGFTEIILIFGIGAARARAGAAAEARG